MENATLEIEKVTVTKWDPAEYIETKESVIAHLEAAFEENDLELLLSLTGDIVRSEGMNRIARELGITREALCQSIAPAGTPSLETVIKLLDILGLRLNIDDNVLSDEECRLLEKCRKDRKDHPENFTPWTKVRRG